jgi:hypothetical protein
MEGVEFKEREAETGPKRSYLRKSPHPAPPDREDRVAQAAEALTPMLCR